LFYYARSAVAKIGPEDRLLPKHLSRLFKADTCKTYWAGYVTIMWPVFLP